MQTRTERWLLPEGIEELLPDQAERLEHLRRRLIDLFASWGYRLVIPPVIEHLESLLVGTGQDLEQQTFKLTDPMTGRLLGIRADMTPQVARIDAHRTRSEAPNRLCYVGPVLHTRPGGFHGGRGPFQVGAELYGHGGVESDVEILHLMVAALNAAGMRQPHIDVGHVGVFRALAREVGLDGDQEQALFDALQRKAVPEMSDYLRRLALTEGQRRMLVGLAELNGGGEVLAEARRTLRGAAAPVQEALDNLERIAALARQHMPGVSLNFDLAELRGYYYQTGVVFAAFAPGHGKEVARGGRYDDIGRAFGRARPATGFSTDLETLIRLSNSSETAGGIFAPAADDPALRRVVDQLRQRGERVCWELPGQRGGPEDMACDRILCLNRGQWRVRPLGPAAEKHG
ncbi:MAG TPA: ATP phosphoribosyltransferase regulatory subunit [Gammaproteobacteria bacterium]|nr:ATP phosphoribosyltransferase regulatory subunit [Gammaproteobacteria bacterium]